MSGVWGLGLRGEIFEPQPPQGYHHYKTVNVWDTQKQLEGLEYIFVELAKFKPSTSWEKKRGVLGIRFLNEASSLQEIPQEFQGELEVYDQYWDAVRTEKTRTLDAWTEGLAQGKEEGKAEGLVEAVYKAIQKGLINVEDAQQAFDLTPDQEKLLKEKFKSH